MHLINRLDRMHKKLDAKNGQTISAHELKEEKKKLIEIQRFTSKEIWLE